MVVVIGPRSGSLFLSPVQPWETVLATQESSFRPGVFLIPTLWECLPRMTLQMLISRFPEIGPPREPLYWSSLGSDMLDNVAVRPLPPTGR